MKKWTARSGSGNGIPEVMAQLGDKVIARHLMGTDRDEAIARMRRALSELRMTGPGILTTAGLLADVIRHPSFLAAEHDTTTLESIIAESRNRR